MNDHIKLSLLGKQVDKGSNQQLGEILFPITDATIEITPSKLKEINPSINLEELYGFNANISCSNIILIISDFDYFTLSAYTNTEPKISFMKVYNVKDFYRLSGLMVRDLYAENANSLIVESEIRSLKVGIEAYSGLIRNQVHENTEKDAEIAPSKVYTDVHDSKIDDLAIFTEHTKLSIDKSNLISVSVRSNVADIIIRDNSEISNVFLSGKIENLTITDSIVDALKGSQGMVVSHFSKPHSLVKHAYNIFEENIADRADDALQLLEKSFSAAQNYEKAADIGYLRQVEKMNKAKDFEKVIFLLLDWSCGFGFKPFKALYFSVIVLSGFAFLFGVLSCFDAHGIYYSDGNKIIGCDLPLNTIYYSTVTFTTTGYGDIVPHGYITKLLAGSEALLGIFTMTVLVYSFTKRYIDLLRS